MSTTKGTAAALPLEFSSCLCDHHHDARVFSDQATAHPWCIRFVHPREALTSPEIRSAWEQLIAKSDNPDVLFQSPRWVEHSLAAATTDKIELAVMENDDGIVGVIPLRRRSVALEAAVRGRRLLSVRVPSVAVLGNRPLMPDDPRAMRQLLQALSERHQDHGVLFRRVVEGSRLKEILSRSLGRRWLLHAADDPQPHHLLNLPGSFEEFLANKGRKTRSRFRQMLKAGNEPGRNLPSLVRVDHPDQVESFLAAAASVSRRSWQSSLFGMRIRSSASEMHRLAALARDGILRAYLLKVGDHPRAFMIGYQYAGTFHLDEFGFDRRFSIEAPGINLLLRAIEDLTSTGSVARLSFGDGHATYKARFSNHSFRAGPVLLLPPTRRYRALATLHRWFLRGRAQLRAILNRSPSDS